MKKIYIVAILCLMNFAGFAATWYSVTAGGDPTVLTNWNSISGGGGTSPSNFTTAGDVFVMQTAMTSISGSTWTLGAGTTLQINAVSFTNYCATINCGNMQLLTSGGIIGEAACYYYLSGDLTFTGTAVMTNPPSYNYIHFSNTGTSLASPSHLTLTSTGSGTYTYIYIDAGVTAALTTNATWTMSYAFYLNGTLDCGSYTFTGTFPFTMSSGCALYVGHPGGINGALNTTGTKTMSTGAIYGFDGTVPQITSTVLPNALVSPGQIVINNPAGVTLSASTSNTNIANALSFVSGTLNTGGGTLTLPGNAGAVSGAGTGKYVIGNLIKTITGFSTVNFEVGDVDYAPMQLTLNAAGTAGSLGVICNAGTEPNATFSGFGLSNMVNHYWTVSNQGAAGPTAVTPLVTYNAADILGGSNASFLMQEFTAGAWLNSPITTTNTTSPYTSNSSASIPLASAAGDYIFGAVVPFVYATPTTLSYGLQAIGSSSVLSFILAGGNLVAGSLTITAPANFQVSASAGGPWTSSITLPYTPPSLGGTPVYVQFNPTAAISYSGNVSVTGGGLGATYTIGVAGTSLPGCSGTPAAGSASSFPTSGTGGNSFTLSLTGVSAVAGLTYQWQSSPDNLTWTNVYGATNSTFIFSGLAANTYFQCLVSCGIFSAASSSQLLTYTGIATSSCIPSSYYSPCTYYAGTTGNPVIINGISGSISDASACGSGTGGSAYYYDNSGTMSATFNQGGTYTTTMGPSYYYVSGQIWIDFNDNGVFEQSETVGGYQNPTSTTIARYHPNIVIPANAAPGQHRMRVENDYGLYYMAGYSTYYPTYPQMNPCPSATGAYVYYADTRDYAAIIIQSPAIITASQSSLAFGNTTAGTNSVPPMFFTLSGSYLAGTPVIATPPANFSLSLDGVNWTSTALSIPYTPGYPTGNLSPVNVYVQFNPTAATTYSGNITFSGATLVTGVTVALTGTGISTCSGSPAAGTVVTTPSSGAGTTNFTLSLSGASVNGGVLYQWQSSPNGTTWSNMPGGVYPAYSFTGIAATTYYRCILTCISGTSSITPSATITYTSGLAVSSCIPSSYSTPCGNYYLGNAANPVIITGTTGSISDPSACGSGTGGSAYYYDNSGTMSVTFNQGGTYNTTIGPNYYYVTGQMWIDFNDNGIFEASETVGGYHSLGTVVIPRFHPQITIPANASLGTHRMRVMNGYGAYYAPGYSLIYPTYPQMNPCPSAVSPYVYYADTRDYTAVITQAVCSGTPNPGVVSLGGPNVGCVPLSTNLVNVGETIASGISYQWQSSSSPYAGFSNVPGATNSVFSPVIATAGTIYYRQTVTCAASGLSAASLPSQAILVNPSPAAITGGTALCPGATLTLASIPATGSWVSSNTAAATIGSGTGILTSIAAGVTNITYTIPTGCFTTSSVTVNPLPAAIGGPLTVCPGSTVTLTDAGGGSWSSSSPLLAPIGSATGIVNGVTPGTSTITYTLPTGCITTRPITVNTIAPITGLMSLCATYTTTLYNAIPGGLWSSSFPSVASINAGSGLLTANAPVSTTITYLFPNGCTTTALFGVSYTPNIYSVSGGGIICPGSNAHIFLSNSDLGVSYQVLLGGVTVGIPVAGTGAPLDLGPQTAVGTYSVIANYGSPCAVTQAYVAAISYASIPAAFNLTGGGAYCAGGTGVHIYQTASASGYLYQLYYGVATAGASITGTGAVIDFGLQTSNGTYTVQATNPVTGCTNTMNGIITVTTNPLPATYTVTGGGNYCSGGAGMPVGLSGSVSGTTYQLFKGGVATGSPVAGTNSPINFGNQTIAGTYTVVATNTTTGCTNNMTGSAVVNIVPLPTLNIVTGGGAYCAGGTGVHIGLNGSVAGVIYKAYNGVVLTGSPVTGTGSAIDMGLFTVAGTYTIVASVPASTCSINMTGTVTVSVNPSPSLFNVTGGGTYCSGSAGVNVGLSGSVIGTNYYLYDNGSLIGGASGTGALLDFGVKTAAGTYTVSATVFGTSCSVNMNGSAIITINPLPAAYNVTGGGNYCAGTGGLHVNLSNSDIGINYQLFYNGTPIGLVVPGSGLLDFGAQTGSGTYTVTGTDAISGCKATMTSNAIIAISPIPAAYMVTGGGNYCVGGTGVHVGLASSNTGISYQLNLAGLPVGAPLAGTGLGLDFGLMTSAGAYTITATNTTSLCTNTMAGSVSVGTLPLPNAYAMTGGGNYCSGGSGMHIGLTNSDPGINYQLFKGSTSAGSAVGGSGTPIDFGLQTNTGTYTVVATNGVSGCINTMTGSETIGINPLPTVYNITGGGNYCPSGTGVHIGLSSSNTGINYQLYTGTTPLGLATAGTGSSLDFGLQTVTGGYTIMAINPVTGCSILMAGSVSVSLSPLPMVHNVTGGGGFSCVSGTGVHIGLNGSETGNTYQLYKGGVLSGSPISGTGSAIDFGLISVGGSYTVVASNTATGCNNNMAGGAVVTVSGLPPAHTITGGGNYCPGSTGVHIGLNGSDAGINYQLFNGTLAVGSPLAGTGLFLDFGMQTATGSYTIAATNTITGCITTMAGSATVGVSSLPVVYNVSGTGSYCFGDAGLHVMLNGSNPGITYTLYNSGTATTTIVAGTGYPLDFGPHMAGNYTVMAASISTICINNMSGTAVITTNPLPGLFNVTGGGFYCAGGAGLDIQLSGTETGVTYQLSAGGTPVGSVLAGTGSAIDFGLHTNAGIYSVLATNSSTGCTRNMSGSAVVAINPLPVAYSVSGGGAYCATGSGSDITLGGSASGITYQLYQGTLATGVPMFGTGSPLDFGMYTVAGNYTVKATDPTTGCNGLMAGSAIISVLPLPAVYTVSGGGAVCTGSAGVDVHLSGSASGISYQLVIDGTNTGSPLAGTGAAIDFGLQAAPGTYTVVATNIISGCSRTMPGSAVVTAGVPPTVYTLNSSSTTGYCSGSAGIMVYLGISDPGVSYQLLRGSSSAAAPVMGTGGLLSFGNQTITGIYTVVATNTSTGCTSNMAGGVSVFTNPLPVVYNLTGGGSYCSGGTGAHIGITGSITGTNYQLYHSGLPIGPAVAGTGAALDMGIQTLAGGYAVYAVNPVTGCQVIMSGTATISILPAPTAYTVTGGGNYCAGSTGLHVGLSGSVTGVSYQLNLGGSPVGAPKPGTGLPLDYGIHSVAGYYTVSATNNSTGCSGNMAGGVVINSVALPAAHNVNGGGGYCAGGAGQIVGLDGSGTGVTYKLYNGSTLVGSPVSGTGFGVNFGLQTASGTYTVIGTDIGTTCNSNMTGSAVININALPDILPVTGGGSYCAGGAGVHVGLGSSVGGINYTLYYGVSTVTTIPGTGAALDFGLQTSAGGYTVKANDPASSCSNLMSGMAVADTISVVAPSVVISTGAGDSLCSGVYTTFTALGTNGGASPAYQWTVNGISYGSGMTYSYYPVNGDVLSITYNSTATCAIPASASNTAVITVLAKEFPAVTISANPGVEVCRGTSVLLTATPAYGGAAPSYIWKKGTTIVGSGTTLSFIPVAGDVITCKMTSNYTCRLANTAASAPVDMVVDTPSTPIVSIAAYPGLSIAEGETLTLEATATNAGLAPTYQWYVNNVAIPGATGPGFSGNNFGNGDLIACNVLSSGSCAGGHGGAEVTLHVSNVGVKTIGNNPAEIHITPNPNNGSFLLSGTMGSDNEVSVEVTDLIGQVVYKSAVLPKNGVINERVQLTGSVANGMYILNLRSGSDNKVFHVVIER